MDILEQIEQDNADKDFAALDLEKKAPAEAAAVAEEPKITCQKCHNAYEKKLFISPLGRQVKKCAYCRKTMERPKPNYVENIPVDPRREAEFAALYDAEKKPAEHSVDFVADSSHDNVAQSEDTITQELKPQEDGKARTINNIRTLQSACNMPVSSEAELRAMTPMQLVKVQEALLKQGEPRFGMSANPLADLVIIAAGFLDQSSVYTEKYYGLSLKGYQDKVESRRKEIEACLNEIVKENPELIKYLGPWTRLGIILGKEAVVTVGTNVMKKGNGQ